MLTEDDVIFKNVLERVDNYGINLTYSQIKTICERLSITSKDYDDDLENLIKAELEKYNLEMKQNTLYTSPRQKLRLSCKKPRVRDKKFYNPIIKPHN